MLSQGERQQVLVARARMAGPLLLVLDEPCAGMDPGVRERFLELARRARDRARFADRVFLSRIMSKRSCPASPKRSFCAVAASIRAGPTHDVVTRETIEAVYDTRLARIEESGGRLWPIWGA